MNYVSDFLFVQKESIKELSLKIKHLPVLMLHLLAYSLIYTIIFWLSIQMPGISLLRGFITYIVKALLFSHLAYTLECIILNDRIYWKHLKEGFTKYLYSIFPVFFVLYLLNIVISPIINQPMMNLLLTIIIYYAFSAVLESVYLGRSVRYDAISDGVRFSIENPLNWGIPQAIIFVLYLVIMQSSNGLLYFHPNVFIGVPAPLYAINLEYLISIFIYALILLYKAVLYKNLAGSNIRKRAYQKWQR